MMVLSYFIVDPTSNKKKKKSEITESQNDFEDLERIHKNTVTGGIKMSKAKNSSTKTSPLL